MNSIYIRPINNDLKNYGRTMKNKKCECCHSNSFYKIGDVITLNFCCIQDANYYHQKYDIAAVIHSIFALIWMQKYLCKDVIFIIVKLLYQCRKRVQPRYKCISCNACSIRGSRWSFIDNKAFCSRYCRKLYCNRYDTFTRNSLYITSKSSDERCIKYIF